MPALGTFDGGQLASRLSWYANRLRAATGGVILYDLYRVHHEDEA